MIKKKIAVLGSTGSIGRNTLKVIESKKKFFKISILAANSNYKIIKDQIIRFKPNFFIIKNKNTFLKLKKEFSKTKTKILNDFNFHLRSRYLDITVAAIPGLAGLEPTIIFTKKSKKILLANKESIICGWSIISSIAKKNKTEIVPLDSEHFSIYQLIKGVKNNQIDKIFLTASGGPFLNFPLKKLKSITPSQAIKHPKWKMGKKISVDSSNLMNKILELLEAKKIFDFDFDKYKIIIHPQSLIHAIVKFKNGITKFLYHETNMMIPIANAMFDSKVDLKDFKIKESENNQIENLQFFDVDKKRFPVIKILKNLNKYQSTPIIINAANEELVQEFLKRKISYNSIINYIFLVLRDKNYKKYAIQRPLNLSTIYKIDYWARKKIRTMISKKNND